MAGMDDLLRMLEPVVRPVGPGRPDTGSIPPIESQSFEQLLHSHATPTPTPGSTPGSTPGIAPAGAERTQRMPGDDEDALAADQWPNSAHRALLAGLDRVENPWVIRMIADNAANSIHNR